jgi:alpha-L-fucosidase
MTVDCQRRAQEELAEQFRWSKKNFWTSDRYEIQPFSPDHDGRMDWWREARLGLFIHFGLYAVLGRNEWVMHNERIPVEEYEKLADRFAPQPGSLREAVRLAQQTGMRYGVCGTKHHEGYCLWDTARTDFNAVKRGPGYDLIREYSDACEEFGLAKGFYYSLMDWHHPDGTDCAHDEAARKRFVDFTRGCIEELLTRYGKVDVLWLDVPAPLSPEQWGAEELMDHFRQLQPGLLINDRFGVPADFATPEEGVVVAEPGRDWEVAMSANHAWGHSPSAERDWRDVRELIRILYQACAHQGNFLLNVGPRADGSLPEGYYEIFGKFGRWVQRNAETVFGRFPRIEAYQLWRSAVGQWLVADERTLFQWCHLWPGGELTLAGLESKVASVKLLTDGSDVAFRQDSDRIILTGLPEEDPDPETGFNVFRIDLEEPVRFCNRKMTRNW